MIKLQAIITTVSLVITTFTLIYKTGYKQNYQRERRYYKKILVPFMENYIKKEDISALSFCKRRITFGDEDIPMYINYLIFQKDEEKIKKVLIVDYMDIYKNDKSVINNMFSLLEKMLFYVVAFLSMFLFVIGFGLIILSLQIFLNLVIGESIFIDIGFFLAGVMVMTISIGFFRINLLKNEDRYSISTKVIERSVNKKNKLYDKKKQKHFFIK